MDVYALNKTTYLPEDLVEGLSTKIWTERHSTYGEFEFRSSDIEATMLALPENSLVTHRGTDEAMLVETHTIEPDGDVGQVLVVKGRSADVILQSRAWTGAKYGKKVKMRQKYSIQNAIMVYLFNLLANHTTVDLASKSAKKRPSEYNTIPNLRIVDGCHIPMTARDRYLENMMASEYVATMLAAGKMGLRVSRPLKDQVPKKTLHVTTAGIVTKPLETTTGITFEVYDGVDRTDGQTVLPAVVFSYAANHLDAPSYVLSSENYKNVALVISASGPAQKSVEVKREYDAQESGAAATPPVGSVVSPFRIGEKPPKGTPAAPSPAGFDRREILVDAGSKDDDDTTAEFLASLPDVGSDVLKGVYERTTSIDGGISTQNPYQYRQDYDLGDKITLIGQFGITQYMQVQEFTLTEDLNGERGFPGLVLWT